MNHSSALPGCNGCNRAWTVCSGNSLDLVLLDLFLPDSQGPDTIVRLAEYAAHLPIVILSGFTDETIAVRALQNGAQDYIVKGEVDSQVVIRSLRYAIERKQAQLALQRSEGKVQPGGAGRQRRPLGLGSGVAICLLLTTLAGDAGLW